MKRSKMQRLTVYKEMLKKQEKYNERYKGFCASGLCALLSSTACRMELRGFIDIEDFPELYTQKPKHQKGVYWWNPYTASARIRAIKNAIKLINEK